ncbi:hypothetical protein LCGC14_1204610 [marine sediment metagenome]|uniref:Uncharacterized protein n=1 Tax=marine sediment metagenome TaxID=412755 RepID=A0A0F9LFY8_9ZZZZ
MMWIVIAPALGAYGFDPCQLQAAHQEGSGPNFFFGIVKLGGSLLGDRRHEAVPRPTNTTVNFTPTVMPIYKKGRKDKRFHLCLADLFILRGATLCGPLKSQGSGLRRYLPFLSRGAPAGRPRRVSASVFFLSFMFSLLCAMLVGFVYRGSIPALQNLLKLNKGVLI